MQAIGGISRGKPEFGIILAVCLLGCGLGLLATGCTSEPAGPLGSQLVENPISGQLDTLTIYDLVSYSALEIEDRNRPLPKQEVLYLGSQVTDGDTTSSAILANYDFGGVYDDTYTPDVLTYNNISYVNLQLLMLRHYAALQTDDSEKFTAEKTIPKYYELRVLDEPFAGEDYPGSMPDSDPLEAWLPPVIHDQDYTVLIPFEKDNLLSWLAAGDTLGLMIREWDFLPPSPGMLGFSSKEMKHAASQIDSFNVDISLGPTIEVKLIEPNAVLYIKPIADTSTFHKIAPPPADSADGLMMRTCLRNYPVLRFDLSQLPANAFINRATLTVVNDPTTSFGTMEAIVVSELSGDYLTPTDNLSLVELETRAHRITGMTSLDPTTHTDMTFNVTTAIQRFVNDVYEGDRGLVLTAGEDFFPTYDVLTIDPDFYFVQFNFFGTDAADDLKPRLKITYSTIDDLQEVGQ